MAVGMKQARRIAKLGVSDFETVAATERLKNDMLRRLERVLFDPGRLAGLAACDQRYCGRKKCAEVCPFGTRRRRLTEIPAVHRLLRKSAGPLYEVRIGRGAWASWKAKQSQHCRRQEVEPLGPRPAVQPRPRCRRHI